MLALEDYRLDNGLRVVLNEDHSAPLVAVNLWYHVGSKNERPGRTGFAHLFEHMLFSGSEHVGNNEHFRYVQSVGGVLNGTTFFDRTNYFETLPSNYLALGLWLESDRMGYFLPALTQQKLDIQREVVKEERRQRYDNVPYGTAFERLLNLGYDPDYSYHWPTIGSMEDLGAASLDDIREFFATWYRPDNATLTLIGDFVPDEAKRLVEQYFGPIPAGGPFPSFSLDRRPLNGERREVVPSPVQLPRVYRLYHLPKMGHRDWIAGDLLTSVLSGDKASRLEKALVLEQQIATDVAAYVLPTEATGIFMLQATANEGVSIDDIERAIDAELARIANEGVTADELTRAKNRAEVEYAHQLENYDSRADLIGMMSTYFNNPALVHTWLDAYRTATGDDLQRVARQYLVADNRVTSLFVPGERMTLDRTNAPQPGPPRPYHFPHVARRTLDNGLRLLVAENHNAPLVSMRSLVRSGADYDTSELAGLASLTAELLDEGAGNRDAVRLAEDLGLLGASLGSGADWDASYISVDTLSRTFGEAFAIFADVNRQPMLPQSSLERVQSERLMELLQQRDEPGAIAGKRFSNLIYGNGTYGNTIIGNPESVARITVDDVRRYFDMHYLPNNGSIVIAGDVDAETALDAASRFFRDWPAADLPPRPRISPKTFESSRIYLIDRPTAVQSEIRIGHIGIPRSTEDYFALSVMNALLGGVFNSRINLNLREKHGYTYGARSMFAFRRQAGPFVVSAPVRNEVTRESITEVFSELRRIRTGDVETQELDDTKNYLMGSFPSTVQSSSDIAGRLLDMELYDLPTDYFDRYRENIGAVSKSDVEHVAQKYIDPDRAIIVIVGNAEQIREPLGSLGMPIHELDIEGLAIA